MNSSPPNRLPENPNPLTRIIPLHYPFHDLSVDPGFGGHALSPGSLLVLARGSEENTREVVRLHERRIGRGLAGGPLRGWRRIYDRVEALVPQVEELAAGRARLEAANKDQHELSRARENALDDEARLLQAEASRRRWRAAYAELPAGANPELAELQESDLVDSKTCDALFDVDNSQLQVQPKEARNSVEISQNNLHHEDIARYLRAELRKLYQAYETLSSNKDKEISALRAVKDFLWNQLRTMDKDNTALLKIKELEAAQATEAAQKLQQNIEELEVAAQKKDDEIARFRALAFDAEKKENGQKQQRISFMMQIFVKINDGKTITLEVLGSDTINSVKAKIQDKEGIPAGHLRLMYINKLLVGSRTLRDQNIMEEDILDIAFRGMQIFVKMSGKTTILEVESSDTIHSVKAKIFDQTCKAPAGQLLFYADKLLEDGCTLADYNIQNDSTVRAEFRFPLRRLHVSVETWTGNSIINGQRRSTMSRGGFTLSWASPRTSRTSCCVGTRLRTASPCSQRSVVPTPSICTSDLMVASDVDANGHRMIP